MRPELQLSNGMASPVARGASPLLRHLQIAGVDALPRAMLCGEALAIGVPGMPDTTANRLMAVAAESRPLILTVRFEDGGEEPPRQLEKLCLRLRGICGDASPALRNLGLAVDARFVAPPAARALQQRYLAGSTLVMMLDSNSDAWLQAWRFRSDAAVQLAMPARVHSPCALLSPEQADGVLPKLLLRVPVGSAWLPLRIDLSRFAASDGGIRYPLLDRALAACVTVGDRLHDLLQWQSAATRHDAWFNRRLAIDIGGIGELVQLRGADPRSLQTLVDLRQLVRHVRETLARYSLRMASIKGMAPCIEQTDPGKRLPSGCSTDDWRMRWKRAVKGMSYRNRNLVCMSPWSVVARRGRADFRHVDLLPLIRDTDAVAFYRSVSVAHWNSFQFREFHLRLAAVLGQKHTAAVFAERL